VCFSLMDSSDEWELAATCASVLECVIGKTDILQNLEFERKICPPVDTRHLTNWLSENLVKVKGSLFMISAYVLWRQYCSRNRICCALPQFESALKQNMPSRRGYTWKERDKVLSSECVEAYFSTALVAVFCGRVEIDFLRAWWRSRLESSDSGMMRMAQIHELFQKETGSTITRECFCELSVRHVLEHEGAGFSGVEKRTRSNRSSVYTLAWRK